MLFKDASFFVFSGKVCGSDRSRSDYRKWLFHANQQLAVHSHVCTCRGQCKGFIYIYSYLTLKTDLYNYHISDIDVRFDNRLHMDRRHIPHPANLSECSVRTCLRYRPTPRSGQRRRSRRDVRQLCPESAARRSTCVCHRIPAFLCAGQSPVCTQLAGRTRFQSERTRAVHRRQHSSGPEWRSHAG